MTDSSNEIMEFDVLIVGAGPAGLSAAIKIRQLSLERGEDISVCVIEKGSEVGAHILSGGVIEPTALNELIPDWKEKGAPLTVEAKQDNFWLMGHRGMRIKLPTPPQMKNHGNYIISLGDLCRWLAGQAEELGVQIFPGFPARGVIFDETGEQVIGATTGDFGRDAQGNEKAGFQAGIDIHAKFTLIAEGCRGHVTQMLEEHYGLRENKEPQTYALGIKEVWEVPAEKHDLGKIIHTVGWPLMVDTYGGSFIYHTENNQISIGFVTGLDYKNPYLSPYQEFQKFKTHPIITQMLEGGKRLSYGARALNEGGIQAAAHPTFPGGALIGCAAGYLNVPKIKGIHTSMKSGMLAAESVVDALAAEESELLDYEEKIKDSWMYKELHKVRNIRPAFRFGLFFGLMHAAVVTYLTRGYEPYTLHNRGDHLMLYHKGFEKPIEYPAPDGKITFDLMSSVYLSNTNHEEDQPCHLRLLDPAAHPEVNIAVFDAPETRYCPAGVYELVDIPEDELVVMRAEKQVEHEKNGGTGEAAPVIDKRLQINAQNCLHCKTCDIKDPTLNIFWTPPEGGGGPNYTSM